MSSSSRNPLRGAIEIIPVSVILHHLFFPYLHSRITPNSISFLPFHPSYRLKKSSFY